MSKTSFSEFLTKDRKKTLFKKITFISGLLLIINISFGSLFFIGIPIVAQADEEICNADVDVMLVMDRSGSMVTGSCRWWKASYDPPRYVTDYNKTEQWCNSRQDPINQITFTITDNKLQAAKDAANTFLGLLGIDDQSGLVSFAGHPQVDPDATLDQALSGNHGSTMSSVDLLIAEGATNIGDAIALGNTELSDLAKINDQAVQAMILLTDGEANLPNGNGSAENPADVAYAEAMAIVAAGLGIKIFTIGLGNDINEGMLINIANVTGAVYYPAASSENLEAIYNTIREKICEYGSISGCKYDDISNLGIIDQDELTMQGWTITLSDGADDYTQVTDENGCYQFSGLNPGTYTVSETLQPGWTQTYPDPLGPDQGIYTITLILEEDVTDADFANYTPVCPNGILDVDEECDDGPQGSPTCTPECTSINQCDYSINGYKYNGNTHLGMTGWTINLHDVTGAIIATDVTQYDGTYSFENLCTGNYMVSEVPQQGWTQTYPTGPFHIITFPGSPASEYSFTNVPDAICGDGAVNQSSEECDDGKNGDDTDGCTDDCLKTYCGDLIIQDTNGYGEIEECDGDSPRACTIEGYNGAESCNGCNWGKCEPDESCGDGITNGNEQCDDGKNGDDTDGCTDNCLKTFCGGTIEICKQNDLNRNGVFDDGEPFMDGWSFNVNDTLYTELENCVVINDLPYGTYVITEVDQAGWELTGAEGNGTFNSQDGSFTVELDSGYEIAYFLNKALICGTKYYYDTDTGIEGWGISLSATSEPQDCTDQRCSSFINILEQTTTDVDGNYCFDISDYETIFPGFFEIAEEQRSGWTAQSPTSEIFEFTGSEPVFVNFYNSEDDIECGDGIKNGNEDCDYNDTSGEGVGDYQTCSEECTLITNPYCGDGNVDSGEQCDDGNTYNGDGCSSSCTTEGGGGGGGSIFLQIYDLEAQCASESSAIVTWRTNKRVTSWVVYGIDSDDIEDADSTEVTSAQTSHSTTIEGLTPGEVYSFTATAQEGTREITKSITYTTNDCVIVKGEEGGPVLEIEKTVDPGTVNAGDTGIRFFLKFKNSGNMTAFNVVITDTLPEGLSYADQEGNTKEWVIGDMLPGETRQVSYLVNASDTIEAGNYPNIAVIVADNHSSVEDTAILTAGDVIVLAESGFNGSELLALIMTVLSLFGVSRGLKLGTEGV